jgi:hypothetical protein
VEVCYQPGASLDLAAADLGTLVVRAGFATVYELGLEEVPQPPPSAIAILNVTGWCSFPGRSPAGLCVMLAGRDRAGELLWACNLPAYAPRDEDPQWLFESLLIDSAAAGQTHRVAVRVSGGPIAEPSPAKSNAAADRGPIGDNGLTGTSGRGC